MLPLTEVKDSKQHYFEISSTAIILNTSDIPNTDCATHLLGSMTPVSCIRYIVQLFFDVLCFYQWQIFRAIAPQLTEY